MLFTCSFLFHGSLNDFLPRKQKEQWIPYATRTPASIKDAAEAIGVPHVEVRCVVVNGTNKSLNDLLQPHNCIEVFPYEAQFPLPAPQSFVLDVHLGKLARRLRMLGIDAAYQNALTDREIVAVAVAQNRAALTRDVGLLKHKILQYGYWLRSQYPREQLLETIRRFSLCEAIRPFSRCIACNGCLQRVEKAAVAGGLPPQTKRLFDEFYQCNSCCRVYWKGSHYENMYRLVEEVRSVACQ